jgi:hypothetical protein
LCSNTGKMGIYMSRYPSSDSNQNTTLDSVGV